MRLLARRAAEAGLAADEQLLLVDADGSVLETDRANVFALVSGVLRTPATDGRILPGIMRARVLAAARLAGLPVTEGRLVLAELLAADEVLVTNSIRGVLPVLAADGRAGGWPPGPVTASLAAAVRDPGHDQHDHRERTWPEPQLACRAAVEAGGRRTPRPGHRQLRLVHLQPRAPAAGRWRNGRGRAQ